MRRGACCAGVALCVAFAGPARAGELSLLVFGDAGVPPEDARRYRTQRAVADAMAMSDAAAPVHGIVVTGDNFYPNGLLVDEAVDRIRANLVRPYCRFLRFDGPEAGAVESACEVPRADRRPVRWFATLGNHDHLSPESPELQRAIAARFFSNWRLPEGLVAVHELPGGVSLIAFDSDPIFRGADARPLAEALRASRGPWRILAAHHPIANLPSAAEAAMHARYARSLIDAVAASGVTVQLVVSGHEHNLQLLALDAPAPRLHAISGGGSGSRGLKGPNPARLAGFEEPGFARVDLVGAPDASGEARLVVSLYGVPGLWSRLTGGGPPLLARRSVDALGRIGE